MFFFSKLFPKKISIFTILLIIAIFTGFILRTWKLTTLPFPPNGDELAFGYYGWSLLHFGTDEYRNPFPFYFPSIGDYKYPVLAYLNILPAIFFGLSEFTVRFWSVISGIALIPLVFMLSRLIVKSNVAAIASAWLIALSPWSLSLPRYGYENNVAVTLTTAALVCLLLSIKSQRKKLYVGLSFILFFISSFTYGTQKVFIPLFLLLLVGFSLFKNSTLASFRNILLIFFLVLTFVTVISLIPWQSRGRASGVLFSTLSAEETNQLEELKIEAGISPVHLPVQLTRLFHNKLRITAMRFLERYSNHFSPEFLFFQGEAGTERIPLAGQLLLVEILLLPLGVLTLLIDPDTRKRASIVIFWLLSAPVASALTVGEPHINRASIMIPAFALISGYGFSQILSISKLKNYYFKFSILFFLFVFSIYSSLFVLNQLFVHKSVHRPWLREQVNKIMVNDVYKIKDNYQAVVISKTDNEYMFFLFYNQISPEQFVNNADITKESKENQWKRVNRLYNIYFKMPFDCPKSGKLNVLYVCTGPNIPQNAEVIKVIRFLDSVPAYTLIRFIPISKMLNPLPQLPERLKYMVAIETDPKSPDGIIPEESSRFW